MGPAQGPKLACGLYHAPVLAAHSPATRDSGLSWTPGLFGGQSLTSHSPNLNVASQEEIEWLIGMS